MAEVRIAGTVSDTGGANEGRAIAALKQLSDNHVVVWGWNCPAGPGFREIDAIVVCETGVFVIEAKNWRGPISGNAQDWEWTSDLGPRRAKSPIEAARNSALALTDYLRGKLERDDRFLDERRRVKFWIQSLVVLLNPTANVHALNDERKLQMVVGVEQVDDSLFKNLRRPAQARTLSEAEVALIADTIFSPIGDPIVGIDFGTTNSLVAYCNDRGDVDLMHVDEDKTLVPSLFTILNGEVLVGNQVEELLKEYDRARSSGIAATSAAAKPENIVFWVKKLLGRRYSDHKRSKEEYPFSIVERGDDEIGIDVEGRSLSPSEISTNILRYLNTVATSRLSGGTVRAVISVPVRFNDRQRRTLEACALAAGFTEVALAIDEATAAALAWTYRSNYSYSGNLVVYDLGGGTFDVSVVEVKHGVVNVKAIRGDEALGGYHFDLALADYLFHTKLGRKQSLLGMSLKTQYAIRRELERARKSLSLRTKCTAIIHTDDQLSPLTVEVTREDLERATAQILDRTFKLCQEALNAAKASGVSEIHDVILSGGMTHTPFIRQQVKEFFFGVDPKKQPILPANPSTLVCEGAALYAGMLMGRVKGARIGERVTPFSYGIDTYKGYPTDRNIYLSVIIERDAKLFDRNGDAQRFSGGNFLTVADGQSRIACNVLQSAKGKADKVLAKDCLPLGTFVVDISPLPAGKNGINVVFCIDKNGILEVEYYEISNRRNRGTMRFNMLLRVDDPISVSSGDR